jgi:ATP-binding cassette subfamily B protein
VPASAPFLLQLRERGLLRHLGVLLASHAAQYALWLLSWYVVGLAALQGRYDGGWLAAWVLLLATIVPLRLLALQRQGLVAVQAGALLKRRLLLGTLRLGTDEVRAQGTGQFLGRVLESDAVETQSTVGGLQGLTAAVELAGAAIVLLLGGGGLLHLGLLIGWAVLGGLLAVRYYRAQRAWADMRLGMTHALIEQMVGHRTRLAQRSRADWHAHEDRALERYLDASGTLDRSAAALLTIVPRGWLVLAAAVLGWAFVTAASPAALAVGLGGTLLAYQALRRLTLGLLNLTGAAVAWRQVAPLFRAAGEEEVAVPAACGGADTPPTALAAGETVLEARGLTFAYPASGRVVLRDATLHIRRGDRLLLEGPSGGGKSTLAALLAALRRPDAGLLLLRGLDPQTLGVEAWRRRVASAPQFHDNHVLTGTLAFNLLLGRAWPPTPQDLEEADALCRALGLGPLLDRMPAGLHQMVGESGWQLSHGEKSRLFLARALLQRADLVLLDESFGALDPENMARSLRCVLERSATLLVIAHP